MSGINFTITMNKDKTISIDIALDETTISAKYKPQTLSENESYQQILKNRKLLTKDECLAIVTGLYSNEKTEAHLEKFVREKILNKVQKNYCKTDGNLNFDKIHKFREALETRIKKIIEEDTLYERDLINNLFPTAKTKRVSSLKLFDCAQESKLELPKWFADTQIKIKVVQQTRAKEKEEKDKLKNKIKNKDRIIKQKNKKIEELEAENKRQQENNKKRFTERFLLLASHTCDLHKNDHKKHSCSAIAKRIETFTGRKISDETVRTTMIEINDYFNLSKNGICNKEHKK